MTSLSTLFHQHIGPSYDKQVYLADSIGTTHRWAFDLEAGIVTFNARLSFNVQILGTQSDESDTWLWSWANHASNLPPALCREAESLREFGQEKSIEAFTTAELPVSQMINGLTLSAIASGVCGADSFYRGEYPGGALFLLITDPRFHRQVSSPLLRIARVFPEMLESFTVDEPRTAFEHYLRWYDLRVDAEADRITGLTPEGGWVRATFDGHTLTTIETEAA